MTQHHELSSTETKKNTSDKTYITGQQGRVHKLYKAASALQIIQAFKTLRRSNRAASRTSIRDQ